MDDKHRQRSGDEARRAHLNGEGMTMETALRAEVAAQLAEDASSPEELHELRATVALLGALPQVAPRRTFILTPELVAAAGGPRAGKRRFGWVWPTRWATAIAAVCFAVTMGLGQGGSVEPTQVVPPPTVAAVAVTPTPGFDPTRPVGALGSVLTVEPVATATFAPPPKPPVVTKVERTDGVRLNCAGGADRDWGVLRVPVAAVLAAQGMATA
ncbi:MAG: hypothetical protein U0841_32100 [Chloroflexia bacterium]